MDPEHIRTLQMLQACCGCLQHHNPRNSESFWYIYYNVAFSHLIPTAYPRKVFLAPQFVLSHDQVDNDGKTKKNAKVPDFCLVHIDMNDNIKPLKYPCVDEIVDYQGILEHFRGPYEIREITVLSIFENKSLPNIKRFKDYSDEEFKEKIKALYIAKFREAFHSIVGQTGAFFAARKDVRGVVVAATVGSRFCWANCERSSVPVPSDNDDSTFEPDGDAKNPKGLDHALDKMYHRKSQADQPQRGKKELRPRHKIKGVSRIPQLVSVSRKSTTSQTVSNYPYHASESEDDNTNGASGNALEQMVGRADALQLGDANPRVEEAEGGPTSSIGTPQPLSRSSLINEPGWSWSQHYDWTEPASWDEMQAMMNAIRDRNSHVNL
ncbi:hypothetical protein CERSUDRAFT_94161 [Gelatoporia subvermispora B]|uniref:Uncharacterized protein n=1 Tax=Ceriporiopsis subvermispora (strain B) TaxID=914234 RepID=M2PQ14_CERS8|nr:hypothetical protein CERSUDRAFT_94161 [Gelatoporia subvermispora B]